MDSTYICLQYALMLDSIFIMIELRSHRNSIKFHLESFQNLSGISMEFPWNSIQIPLGVYRNHSGITLKFQWNSTGNPAESARTHEGG